MADSEQNSETRNMLARLDVLILTLNAEITVAAQTEITARASKDGLRKVRDEFVELRQRLRPLLDSSAPVEIY